MLTTAPIIPGMSLPSAKMPEKPQAMTAHLSQVDGLRTVAIFWVALYHYAVFWSPAGAGLNLLPYGDALAWIPFAKVGYLGVYLFFIVSGFVITLSLQRSQGLLHFAKLRAIRLWPTLLICGSLTFAITTLFGPPDLVRGPLEYLISLTFIPPPHLGKVIGVSNLEWLDGAYWSLWTEVRFYIIVGVFYAMSPTRFLGLWAGFAIYSVGVHLAGLAYGGSFEGLSRLIFAQYQPYFSAGIAIAALRARQHCGDQPATGPVALLALSILQAFTYPWLAAGSLTVSVFLGLVFVFALALFAMLSRRRIPVLGSRPMVILGAASYAYYLLHQNLGLALLAWINPTNEAVGIVLMVLIQAMIMGAAIVRTVRIEAPLRRFLRSRT